MLLQSLHHLQTGYLKDLDNSPACITSANKPSIHLIENSFPSLKCVSYIYVGFQSSLPWQCTSRRSDNGSSGLVSSHHKLQTKKLLMVQVMLSLVEGSRRRTNSFVNVNLPMISMIPQVALHLLNLFNSSSSKLSLQSNNSHCCIESNERIESLYSREVIKETPSCTPWQAKCLLIPQASGCVLYV